jgi:L-ascorbate metabolism protein UlaG (beta-lactamase superfamily)
MAKLLYQGHGSLRITTKENLVIYVDPYAGEGYDLPADIILVSHQHGDHNQINMVAKKPTCRIVQNYDVLKQGIYKKIAIDSVLIEAVPAYNKNHKREESVGYIIIVEGVEIYVAGDTSTTEEMTDLMKRDLDYVFLPIDGIYNMDAVEATRCAEIIGAKKSIPYHMMPGALFDMDAAKKFEAKNRLILQAGEEIEI